MDCGGLLYDRKAFSGLHVLAQQKRRKIRAFLSEEEQNEQNKQKKDKSVPRLEPVCAMRSLTTCYCLDIANTVSEK